MPIFQTKYEKNEGKETRDMISVPMCREDITYLNLYALCKRTSTVAIHRKAVHDWVAGKVNKYVLLGEIQSTCQRHWYHHKDSYCNFQGFLNAVKVELTEAGIPLNVVEGLTKNLKEI
jgi:hypothetical protein